MSSLTETRNAMCAYIGRIDALSLTPDILCWKASPGYTRAEQANDWSDAECQAYCEAFDQHRGSLYKLSEFYGSL